jgi:mRNA interferase MazF
VAIRARGVVEGAGGLKRGEIWTVAGGADYAGKPRAAIILQSDKFDETLSVTICPLTREAIDAEPARFAVEPTLHNGLRVSSYAMVDKISTLPKTKVRRRIGQLDAADVARLNQHVILFLGLAE